MLTVFDMLGDVLGEVSKRRNSKLGPEAAAGTLSKPE
jgi:hypothetical protein